MCAVTVERGGCGDPPRKNVGLSLLCPRARRAARACYSAKQRFAAKHERHISTASTETSPRPGRPCYTIEPDAEASGYPHTRQATPRETTPEPAAAEPPHCCQGDRRRCRCLDCGQVRIDKEYA